MENKGLLFIPDISGFTRFVNEVEIEHSRLIIQELLEILVDANETGLEVSEIEGDAILFYKFGAPPSLEELYHQVEKMFCAFHRSLVAYEHTRYCQCRSCAEAIGLTLKVITHYGEFTGYNVRQFNKLIGKDIIVAHQLLKNDIDGHEYWLLTPGVAGEQLPPAALTQWMNWNAGVKQTESGDIPFVYTQLGKLKEAVQVEPLPPPDLTQKTKLVSASREYPVNIIKLFHATGDFNYRSQWQEGIEKVEAIAHLLPRVGMRCRLVRSSGESVVFSSSYHYQPDRIAFTETEEGGQQITAYTLEAINENQSRLTVELYGPRSFLSNTGFRLFKRRAAKASLERSLERLGKLLQTEIK
jgi:hypothetical protein